MEPDEDYGRVGRIDSSLKRRIEILGEVDRLVKSLEIEGDYSYSCETAYYFNM